MNFEMAQQIGIQNDIIKQYYNLITCTFKVETFSIRFRSEKLERKIR